ncbi:RHS repeat domain-containing protein [Arenimonas sp. MALMAid1274]|uniref:RHS repeat domain-containing protein n=1 Tax=Arenimonas sp. MALMAid1274 TaxID=3411630 RepID=UPI003B9DCCFC
MAYDALDRLTEASSGMFGGSDFAHRFTYDALDNLRSWKHAGVKDYANYQYDSNNLLTGIRNTGGTLLHTINYGVQGNVSSKNGHSYTFDLGNRMRAGSGTNSESYRYDALGRRVQTTRAGGATTLWHYSQGGQLLFSSKLPGGGTQTTHENVYLGGSVVAIIDHDWPSNTVTALRYQHTDALGSPVAESNAAGALIGTRTNYDPFGGAIGKIIDGIGYTGHVMDAGTGLTYMQQRYYDPEIGRFLSVDPVTASSVNGGNFNRYWYANNNPYKFSDPDGRRPFDRMLPGGTCVLQIRCGPLKFPEARPRQKAPYDGALAKVQEKYPQVTTELTDLAFGRISADNLVSTMPGGKEWGFEINKNGAFSPLELTKSEEGTVGGVPWSGLKGIVKAVGHTHGRSSEPSNKYFSSKDVAAARAFNAPVFMGNNFGEFRAFVNGMRLNGRTEDVTLYGGSAEGVLLCEDCIPVSKE